MLALHPSSRGADARAVRHVALDGLQVLTNLGLTWKLGRTLSFVRLMYPRSCAIGTAGTDRSIGRGL